MSCEETCYSISAFAKLIATTNLNYFGKHQAHPTDSSEIASSPEASHLHEGVVQAPRNDIGAFYPDYWLLTTIYSPPCHKRLKKNVVCVRDIFPNFFVCIIR
jgi:hypothetical protein